MANAITADAFVDTLGVNTHIGDAGAYSDTSMVEQNLSYLGVTIVRDSIDSASVISTWQAIAQATGVKFDDYMPEGAPAWDQSALALVPQLAQDGLLAYVEGGNEEDDSYATANGNSLAWTAQFQQQVFAMGQEYDIPVINMSFGSGWTAANNWEGDYPDVGNLSAYTDYANAHTYPNVGQTPNETIQSLNSDAELAASSRPVITTEIGWQTSQFSETTIAQYVVDATFDGIMDGDAGMWFYGLYDDSSGDWGLFNSNGTPRPAATALHDLTTLLADTGSNAASFTPGSLAYSLSGTQSGDNSILIEKSNGTFWIGLWDETGTQHTVTVTLPSAASAIEVYDPITGTTAIQSASNASSIAVSLGGDPLLIEVVPSATTGSTSTTGSGVTSSGGTTTGGSTATGTSTTATPQDLAVTVPATETVTAGAQLAVSGVSVSDAWATSASGAMALNVWDNTGTLTIDGQTFGPGGGPVANGMFSGTLAQINADLATLSYTAASGTGSDTITIDVWNQAGVEVEKTIAVTIAAPATTGSTTTSTSTSTTSATGPVLTLPGSETAAAGSSVTISGASITDAFAASNPGAMALNLTATDGTIAMTNSSGVSISGSGTEAISVTGSLAQINADLATLTYTAGSTAGAGTISLNVWDQAGLQTTGTIGVTVSAEPTVTIAASNADPVELVSNTVISAVAGNHMIFIGGTGNTVTATGGTDTVQAFQGQNSITTGSGNDTISIAGSGNIINAGSGNNTVQDSGTDNTIVMPGAGHGFDNIFGYVLQNGDTLDFRAALAQTAWNGSAATVGDFLQVTTSGGNALISLSTTSGGSASQIAELQGAGTVTLSGLLAHATI